MKTKKEIQSKLDEFNLKLMRLDNDSETLEEEIDIIKAEIYSLMWVLSDPF